MVETTQAAAAPAAAPGQLRTIGDVAAQNITKALGLPAQAAKTIERAIADEIQAMSSHFTLAIADVQTQYEIEVARVKAAFSYVKANPVKVGLVLASVFALGAIVGHFA